MILFLLKLESHLDFLGTVASISLRHIKTLLVLYVDIFMSKKLLEISLRDRGLSYS